MKKLLVFLGLLLVSTAAVAENDGTFIGVQAAKGSVTSYYEVREVSLRNWLIFQSEDTLKGTRYGFLLGGKSFWGKLGVRYYFGANFGKYGAVSARDYHFNLDFLCNLIDTKVLSFGAFAGVGLGYKSFDDSKDFIYSSGDRAGFLGKANLGVRANVAEHHGVELFYEKHYGRTQKDGLGEYFYGEMGDTMQEYRAAKLLGVRYIYTF